VDTPSPQSQASTSGSTGQVWLDVAILHLLLAFAALGWLGKPHLIFLIREILR
jgi:hypothetical protein